MNPHESPERPVNDERLSAYFDGEASPDERAAVESLLDDSLAARRELDEIAQLSALLHSFPRETAPVELAANVQRQTDQMPLAAQLTSPASPARSLRREWTAAFSGAVVTAAALLLMAGLVDRTSPLTRSTIARNELREIDLGSDRMTHESERLLREAAAGRIDAVTDTPALAEFSGGGGLGAARFGVEAKDAKTEDPLMRRAVPQMMSPAAPGGVGAGGAASNAPVAAKAAPPAFMEAPSNQALGNTQLLADNGAVQNFYVNNTDFLNGLKVGEVYQFVPQVANNDNNVAVVDLAVLDVERGADQVRVLLSNNSIRPKVTGQPESAEKMKAQQRMRDRSQGGNNELVVVYSVGPGEQLAKTLEDMSRHPDLFVGWAPQPPVQLVEAEDTAAQVDDTTSAKDAAVAATKPAAEKSGNDKLNEERQLTTRRKEASSWEDNMNQEAELALNALLARNTSGGNGLVNYGTNFQDANTAAVDGNTYNRSAAGPRTSPPAPAGAPNLTATQSVKAIPADPKSTIPLAANATVSADEAGKGGIAKKGDGTQKESGTKQDADVRELERRSSYQTTFRVPTEATPPLEPLQQLNRSNTLNIGNVTAQARRNFNYNNAPLQQQAENANRFLAKSNNEANRAVKVLFVLHPMPTPAADPAGKQNP